MFKLLLDPGHGEMGNPYGHGYGAKGITEGRQMWKLSNLIINYIGKNFVGVQVDRTKKVVNSAPELAVRGGMAKGYNLFLSLHTNAAANLSARGAHQYYAIGDRVKAKSYELAKLLAKEVGTKVFGLPEDRSRAIAREHPSLKGRSYYGVLRAAEVTGVPAAIMMENGYHTNIDDLKVIGNDKGLEKLAQVTCETLGNYYKWERVGAGGGGADAPSKDGELRTYTVVKGDTLWKIAQNLLGDGERYREIVSLNSLKSTMLGVGQVLKLPADSKQVNEPNVPVEAGPQDKLVTLEAGTPIYSQLPSRKIEKKGIFTIVEEKDGFGKLKSGVGWVYLGK